MTPRLLVSSALALCLGVLAFAAGCDEKLSDIAGPTPGLDPTFSSIQDDIFESSDASGRAACIQCHTRQGRTPPLGLSLEHDVASTRPERHPDRVRERVNAA